MNSTAIKCMVADRRKQIRGRP